MDKNYFKRLKAESIKLENWEHKKAQIKRIAPNVVFMDDWKEKELDKRIKRMPGHVDAKFIYKLLNGEFDEPKKYSKPVIVNPNKGSNTKRS